MKKLLLVIFVLIFNNIKAQDVYKVKFIAGTTQYYSALVLYNDGSGKMRTKFYDYNRGGSVMLEQTMKVENTKYGLRITGYNPVYPGTYTTFPNYSPDNFYLSTDYNGNTTITNIDDQGNTSAATIEHITGYYSINSFLSDFNWHLN